MPGVHHAARRKEEDERAERAGGRSCVKVLSDELTHDSASEGTERGWRGGVGGHWRALNEVRRSPCRV